MRIPETDLRQAVQVLERLPFVHRADVRPERPGPADRQADAVIVLHTPAGNIPMQVEIKRTHLTHAIIDGVIARAAKDEAIHLLVAPYVPPKIAERVAEADLNYVDAAGNYRIAIGDRYHAEKTGLKPTRKPAAHREMRLAGYQVLFTLLARPDALQLTVRELANLAGVGKTAAAETVRTLTAQGLIGKGEHRQLLDRQELLDRWLAGYVTFVRPRLFIGTYQTRFQDPTELEAAILRTVPPDVPWAFGGGAAAYRIARYYRGPITVVHTDAPPERIARPLQALEAEDGPLVILGAPGPVAFEGIEEHTAHPLLVYTELHVEGTGRAREAARDLAERFPDDLL